MRGNYSSWNREKLDELKAKEMHEDQFNELKHNQPERSKREDFCLTELADEYIDQWQPFPSEFATTEEAYIKGVYDFLDWLKQKMRCSEQSGNRLREVQ